MRKRIFISGPMSKNSKADLASFSIIAAYIARVTDFIPVHIAWITDELTDEERIEMANDMLSICDMICVLDGWNHSESARVEVSIAKAASMPLVELENLEDEFGRYNR